MSKPENVLIIDPAQELKFKGKFCDEKAFVKKESLVQKNPQKAVKNVQLMHYLHRHDLNNAFHMATSIISGEKCSLKVLEKIVLIISSQSV